MSSYVELGEDKQPVSSWKHKLGVAGVFCALLVLIPLGMAYSICSCLADLCQDGN